MKYKKIKLNDLLNISKDDYNEWTICLNELNNEEVKTFSSNKKDYERLMEHISFKKSKDKAKVKGSQSFRNINTTYCLQFQRLEKDKGSCPKWLFLGAYKNKGVIVNKKGNEVYDLELLDKYSCYLERLVIEYKKHQGDKQAKIPTILVEELDVVEVLPDIFVKSDRPFDGYDKIRISFRDLTNIINNNIKSWKEHLTKVQCIYLITDTSNGKLYVGSTYGSDGIWQRWSSYVNTNGSGGDKELVKLIKDNPDYAYKNFQFSILETFLNADGNAPYILQRETYWKDVLNSRVLGYNKN